MSVNVKTNGVNNVSSVDVNNSFSRNTSRYVYDGPWIDVINEEEFLVLIPSFVLIIVIVMAGIPGNVITICVYYRRMRHTAARLFVLALASCDLINCALTMPFELWIIANYWSFDIQYLCSIGHTLTYIFNGTSALLLCGIAVDRFRKICRPLKPVFTPKKVKFICLLSLFLATAFYIPGFFIYGTQTVEFLREDGNVTVVGKRCQIKDKYEHSKLIAPILGVWFLATVIISVVLTVVYIAIGKVIYERLRLEEKRRSSVSTPLKPKTKLRRVIADDSSETSCSFGTGLDDAHPNRSQSPKTRHGQQPRVLQTMSLPAQHKINQTLKERFRLSMPTVFNVKQKTESNVKRIRAGRTTLMLFSVTVAYVLSFIPFVVIVSVRTSSPNTEETLSAAGKTWWNFFLRSYVINCAINPFLYGIFNKDFRRKMCDMLQGLFCK